MYKFMRMNGDRRLFKFNEFTVEYAEDGVYYNDELVLDVPYKDFVKMDISERNKLVDKVTKLIKDGYTVEQEEVKEVVYNCNGRQRRFKVPSEKISAVYIDDKRVGDYTVDKDEDGVIRVVFEKAPSKKSTVRIEYV